MPESAAPYDLVVVGAGPAGIAAACTAAESGLRVAVLDQAPGVGGQIWRSLDSTGVSRAARGWIDRLRQSGAQVFPGAAVFDATSRGVLRADSRTGPFALAWRKLVVATGARELFLPFEGWTLPGVVGTGGLQSLVKGGWPVAGSRVIVAGSGPLLLAVAAQLRHAGGRITSVAEQASFRQLACLGLSLLALAPGKYGEALGYLARLRGARFRTGCWPIAAAGRDRLESVTLTNGTRTWIEPCDLLACGFGLVPNLELPRLLGCRLDHGTVWTSEFQETSLPGVFCAGEPTGIGGADLALIEGQIAGLAAAGKEEAARTLFAVRRRGRRLAAALAAAYPLRAELRRAPQDLTVVCRCEDLRWSTIAPYASWREAKLHTRCGMGNCQGRTCGDILQALKGWEAPGVRPPLLPVPLAALGGVGKPDHLAPRS